jgi:hypothetical protein
MALDAEEAEAALKRFETVSTNVQAIQTPLDIDRSGFDDDFQLSDQAYALNEESVLDQAENSALPATEEESFDEPAPDVPDMSIPDASLPVVGKAKKKTS